MAEAEHQGKGAEIRDEVQHPEETVDVGVGVHRLGAEVVNGGDERIPRQEDAGAEGDADPVRRVAGIRGLAFLRVERARGDSVAHHGRARARPRAGRD